MEPEGKDTRQRNEKEPRGMSSKSEARDGGGVDIRIRRRM
jgi:hypothetical protein